VKSEYGSVCLEVEEDPGPSLRKDLTKEKTARGLPCLKTGKKTEPSAGPKS